MFSILFLSWILLSGADPREACWQEYNFDLGVRACTLIIENQGYSSEDVTSALFRRGLVFKFMGETDRAYADFDRAIAGIDSMIQRNSLNANAFFMRAVVNTGRRNFPQAVADYGEAIRLNPQDLEAFNMRCWARAIWGSELDIARADCDTAIKLSNGNASYFDTRGLLGLKEGKFADAWSDYNAALQAKPDPDTAHYLYGRGIAALRLGRMEEGNADLRKALELHATVGKMFAEYGVAP